MVDFKSKYLVDTNSDELVNLISQSAVDFLKSVQAIVAGTQSFPPDFPCLSLAEWAELRIKIGQENDLLWGYSAILLFEYMALLESKSRFNSLWHAMLRRKDLILQHGNQPGDYVRDINIIIRAFRYETNMRADEAYAIMENDSRRKGPEGEKLNYIIDLLKILLELKASGRWEPENEQELCVWVAVEDAYARRFWNRKPGEPNLTG